MAKLLTEERRIYRHTGLENKLVREVMPGEECECCEGPPEECWRIANQCCTGEFVPVYVPCDCAIFQEPEFDQCVFRVNPAFEDDCWRITPGSGTTTDPDLVAQGRIFCPAWPTDCMWDSCPECCPDIPTECLSCCDQAVCPQLPQQLNCQLTITYDINCVCGYPPFLGGQQDCGEFGCTEEAPSMLEFPAVYAGASFGEGGTPVGCLEPACGIPQCKTPLCDEVFCGNNCCCCYMVGPTQCNPNGPCAQPPFNEVAIYSIDCGLCTINCCGCNVQGFFRFFGNADPDLAYWEAFLEVSPFAELTVPSDPSQGCAEGNCWRPTIHMRKYGCGPPIGSDWSWWIPNPQNPPLCISGASMDTA